MGAHSVQCYLLLQLPLCIVVILFQGVVGHLLCDLKTLLQDHTLS